MAPAAHAAPLETGAQRGSARGTVQSPGVAPASLKRKRSAPLTPRRAGDLSAVLAELEGLPGMKGSTADANGTGGGGENSTTQLEHCRAIAAWLLLFSAHAPVQSKHRVEVLNAVALRHRLMHNQQLL